MAALDGATISGEVYAWIIVFVLPINSAINPILYTFAAQNPIKVTQPIPLLLPIKINMNKGIYLHGYTLLSD